MIGRGPATLGAFYRLAAGEAIAKVAGLVAFAWLARRLGPEGYGAVEVAVSIALIAGLVVDAGLGPVGARAVGLAPESASPLAARIPTLRLLLAASCLGAVAVALPLMSSPWEHRALTVLFTLSVLGWIWNQNWLCQGLGRPALASAAQPVRMGVFALGVVLLVRSPSDLLRVGWLEIAGVLALAGYFLWAQGRLGVPVSLRFEHTALAALLREALPVGLGQFLWAIGHALPILLTAALLGGDEVAWIGAAVRIEIGLHAFIWLYYFALYPRLVSATGTADPELDGLLRRAQARIVWLVLPIAIAGAVASGPLARLVFGGGFDRAASVLETALWALPIAAASGTSRFLLIAAGRQRLELVAAAVGAAAVALCGFALIPSRGADGAAVALLVGGLAHWGVAAALSRRSITGQPGLAGVWLPAAATLLALGAAHLLDSRGPFAAGGAALAVFGSIALASGALRRSKL